MNLLLFLIPKRLSYSASMGNFSRRENLAFFDFGGVDWWSIFGVFLVAELVLGVLSNIWCHMSFWGIVPVMSSLWRSKSTGNLQSCSSKRPFCTFFSDFSESNQVLQRVVRYKLQMIPITLFVLCGRSQRDSARRRKKNQWFQSYLQHFSDLLIVFLYSIYFRCYALPFLYSESSFHDGWTPILHLTRSPPQFWFHLGRSPCNVRFELWLVEGGGANEKREKRENVVSTYSVQRFMSASRSYQFPTNHHIVEFTPQQHISIRSSLTVNPSKSGTTSSSFFFGSAMNRALLFNRPSLVPPFPL